MEENVEALVIGKLCSGTKIITGEGSCLCHDVIYNILSRLPVESLVRFKSVCKNWRNMISDLDQVVVRQLMAKVVIFCPPMSLWPWKGDLFFKLKKNGIDSFFCCQRKYFYAEKAYKNFVLFRFDSVAFDHMLFVYDAINYKFRQLPKTPLLRLYPALSLVYDASAETCKVIALSWGHCCIYSLNSGSENWKTFDFSPSLEINVCCSSVDLNGLFYWIAKSDDGAFIQSLDIAGEELISIIEVPCQPWSINCNLLAIKGSLCYMNAALDDELHIWVMKDSVNSLWILRHKISLQSMVHRPNYLNSFMQDKFRPCLVVQSIDTTYILVTMKNSCPPFWYNMKTNELSQIAMDYESLRTSFLLAFSFIDFDLVPDLEDLGAELEDLVFKRQELKIPLTLQ